MAKKEKSDKISVTQTVTGDSTEEVMGKLGASVKGEKNGDYANFAEESQNPKYMISIKRQHPRKFNGEDISGNLERINCPIRRDELEEHIKREYGGGKYWIGVLDQKDEIKAGVHVDIPGDPIVPEEKDDSLSFLDDDPVSSISHSYQSRRGIFEERGRVADPAVEMERMNRSEIEELNREILKEKLRQQHRRLQNSNSPQNEEVKALKEQFTGLVDALNNRDKKEMEDHYKHEMAEIRRDVDSKFERMMDKMTENPQSSRVDETLHRVEEEQRRRDEEHKREMGRVSEDSKRREEELKRQLDQQKNDQSKGMFMKLMSDQMNSMNEQAMRIAESAKTSSEQSIKMLKDMSEHRDKVNQREIEMLKDFAKEKNVSHQSSVEQMRDVLGMVAELAPLMAGSGEPEDLPSKLMKVLEKTLPEITKMAKSSNTVTPEQQAQLTRALINREARRIAAEEVEKHNIRMAQAQAEAAKVQAQTTEVKPSTSENPTPKGAPMGGAPPTPEQEPKEEPEAKGVPMGPSSQQQEPLKDSAIMALHKEYTEKVNNVLKLIIEEIESRPVEGKWVKKSWDTLPEDILGKIVYAESDTAVYEAIKDWGDDELMEEVNGFIEENNEARGWLVKGINQIKALAQKNMKGAEKDGG